MQPPATAPRLVEIATLGERLSALRLCDAGALTAMRRSLEQQGQLCALTLFPATSHRARALAMQYGCAFAGGERRAGISLAAPSYCQ